MSVPTGSITVFLSHQHNPVFLFFFPPHMRPCIKIYIYKHLLINGKSSQEVNCFFCSCVHVCSLFGPPVVCVVTVVR